MSADKKTTKGIRTKRDMIEFFVDASKKKSNLGPDFLQELKNGVKAKDLHQKLVDWGYPGVRLEDVTRLLKMYRTSNNARNLVLEKGY